ncbi:MAG TPA: hypothetical protein VFV39_07625 [Limnobacter sp.]|nr:hypothetical protein [Limnobacter sp.]
MRTEWAGILSRLNYGSDLDGMSDHLKALGVAGQFKDAHAHVNAGAIVQSPIEYAQLAGAILQGVPAEDKSNFRGHEVAARLASMQLVAAGFNTKTLERDAPRMDEKLTNSFSISKRWLSLGGVRQMVKKPSNHLKPRLVLLDRMQEEAQRTLFFKSQINVAAGHLERGAVLGDNLDPAPSAENLNFVQKFDAFVVDESNGSLSFGITGDPDAAYSDTVANDFGSTNKVSPEHFASLLVLAMPRNFLVLNPDVPKTIQKALEENTLQAKANALFDVYQDVAVRLGEFEGRVFKESRLRTTTPQSAGATGAASNLADQPMTVLETVALFDKNVRDVYRLGAFRTAARAIASGWHFKIVKPFVVTVVEPIRESRAKLRAEASLSEVLQRRYVNPDQDLRSLLVKLERRKRQANQIDANTSKLELALIRNINAYVQGKSPQIDTALDLSISENGWAKELVDSAIAYVAKISKESSGSGVRGSELTRLQSRAVYRGTAFAPPSTNT